MDRGADNSFPWRVVIFGVLTITLFALAFYYYNNLQPRFGLMLLGVSFAVPMVWAIVAARTAEYSDSPVRDFVPRITVWLVLGSMILGTMQWNLDRDITAMEAGFAVFYVVAAWAALRVLKGRPKRPQLTALNGGNIERRQRRRSR